VIVCHLAPRLTGTAGLESNWLNLSLSPSLVAKARPLSINLVAWTEWPALAPTSAEA